MGWDRVRPPARGIVVLIFHRVGHGDGGQMDVDPRTFHQQLAWITDRSRVLSLDAAADELIAADPGGGIEPGVVVTFDDGTTDWVDHVLPALEDHHVPATFYVATDFVDQNLAFPGNGRPISWAGLRELASSPFTTIGSHTHRHVLLDRVPVSAVAEELDRSIELLGDHVGTNAQHFAYPKAIVGSVAAEEAVRSRFRTAVLAGTRPNLAGTDLHRIMRSPIQRADGVRAFRHKVSGGMHLEDDLRSLVNKFRYRTASS